MDVHDFRVALIQVSVAMFGMCKACRMRCCSSKLMLLQQQTNPETRKQVQRLRDALQQQQQVQNEAQALHEQQLLERLRVRDAEVGS